MIKQIDYLTREDMGFDYQNLVAVPTYSFWNYDESGDRALEVFQQELEKHPEILAVTGTSGYGTPMGYSNSTDYEFQDSLVTVAHMRGKECNFYQGLRSCSFWLFGSSRTTLML